MVCAQQSQSQVIWESEDFKHQPSLLIWEPTIPDSERPDEDPEKWKIFPEDKEQNHLPSSVIWEVLRPKMPY